jgi:hypothetical protein
LRDLLEDLLRNGAAESVAAILVIVCSHLPVV